MPKDTADCGTGVRDDSMIFNDLFCREIWQSFDTTFEWLYCGGNDVRVSMRAERETIGKSF